MPDRPQPEEIPVPGRKGTPSTPAPDFPEIPKTPAPATPYSTITALAKSDGTAREQPPAGVLLDSGGDLFGTALMAWSTDLGTVWEIAAGSNTMTILGSFSGSNGANPYAGLTMGAGGRLCGTTLYGGTYGDGAGFALDSGATFATPEPSSLAMTTILLASGGVGLALRRRLENRRRDRPTHPQAA